jgi:hypothetical protein
MSEGRSRVIEKFGEETIQPATRRVLIAPTQLLLEGTTTFGHCAKPVSSALTNSKGQLLIDRNFPANTESFLPASIKPLLYLDNYSSLARTKWSARFIEIFFEILNKLDFISNLFQKVVRRLFGCEKYTLPHKLTWQKASLLSLKENTDGATT